MNWPKENSLVISAIVLLSALLTGETWLGWRSREGAGRALAVLEIRKQERDRLGGHSPALTEENEQAIARELAKTGETVVAMRAAMLTDGDLSAPLPENPSELYFDIAGFVRQARELATQAHVAIRPEECFGFASYANAGPTADLIPAVFRQRMVGQRLVEALIESRPHSLLAVRRERPQLPAQRGQPEAAGMPPGNGLPADYFEFKRRALRDASGRLDGDAFQLEFTGQTRTLRTFLSTLAAGQPLVIVRSVDVEPVSAVAATTQGTDHARPASGVSAPTPLVAQNPSKFTIVVEVVRPAVPMKEPVL